MSVIRSKETLQKDQVVKKIELEKLTPKAVVYDSSSRFKKNDEASIIPMYKEKGSSEKSLIN